MTTSTLISSVGYNQNQAGPAVPAPTVVDAGKLIGLVTFTLSVTPVTGWAAASINWSPNNVDWPGQIAIIDDPQSGGSTSHPLQLYQATNEPSNTPDGARYFKAELTNISPGATATLTMTY